MRFVHLSNKLPSYPGRSHSGRAGRQQKWPRAAAIYDSGPFALYDTLQLSKHPWEQYSCTPRLSSVRRGGMQNGLGPGPHLVTVTIMGQENQPHSAKRKLRFRDTKQLCGAERRHVQES